MYQYDVQVSRRIRLIINTDAKNEADDQFCVVHACLTPKFDIRGIIGAQFGTRRTQQSMQESVDECKRFFQDLCTVAELKAMEQRFEVALLLDEGMIYNDILERTGASSATISRVNRALHYGADGYQQVLPRIRPLWEEEKNAK